MILRRDGLMTSVNILRLYLPNYCYMRTSGSYSYIKVYMDKNGFVTYAKPMSMFGSEDEELSAVINEINDHFA